MKIKILKIILFFLMSSAIYAQDKLVNVEDKMTEVLSLIESGNIEKLKQESTQKMYCLLCFESTRNSYFIDSKTFYKKHFSKIFTPELLKRINQNDKKIITEDSENADFITLYTVYKPNEFSDGNEGMQFGFWFKNVNGSLKLSGIETIP